MEKIASDAVGIFLATVRGLDLTDRFYRDGLDLLPDSVAEVKQPNFRIISGDGLKEAAAASPDFIICYAVLTHVPPSETSALFDRLMSLKGIRTVILLSFYEAAKSFRRGEKAGPRMLRLSSG